jgi:hypothetical protein
MSKIGTIKVVDRIKIPGKKEIQFAPLYYQVPNFGILPNFPHLPWNPFEEIFILLRKIGIRPCPPVLFIHSDKSSQKGIGSMLQNAPGANSIGTAPNVQPKDAVLKMQEMEKMGIN